MVLRWDRINIVKAVRENLASRARRRAAQERARIRNEIDAKIMLKRMNHSSRIYCHVYESARMDRIENMMMILRCTQAVGGRRNKKDQAYSVKGQEVKDKCGQCQASD